MEKNPEEVIQILQVDAFTTRPYAGNPAAVVLEPGQLTEEGMQAIAKEMNLSETAFLLPPARPDADLRVRWFTPAVEVDLCGHATVATFHAAFESGRLGEGTYRMECRSGLLPVGLTSDEEGKPVVTMGLPVPDVEPLGFDPGLLLQALGLEPSGLTSGREVVRVNDWAIVPVERLESLHRLALDMARLRALTREGIGNTIVITRETAGKESLIQLRMFAPAFGIDEDPVTGSAQGPVAAWLAATGQLPAGEGECHYMAEQGDAIGRPGRLRVKVERAGEKGLAAIRIEGRAVTILKGTLTLPRV